ncbi:glycosyltransferase family 4 protein, partial [bacterium]|nr:glycosyltransferase family 4 protein [bacterium]
MRIGLLCERLLPGFGMDRALRHLLRGLAAAGVDTESWVVAGAAPDVPGEVRTLGIPQLRPYLAYEARALARFRPWRRRGVDGWLVASLPFHACLPWLGRSVVLDFGLPPATGMAFGARVDFAAMGFLQHKVVWRFARRLLTISDFLRQSLPRPLAAKTDVLPLGGDFLGRPTPPLSRREARDRLGLPRAAVIPLWVGRMDPAAQPYKGVAELAAAARAARRGFPNLLPLAVGTGPAPVLCSLRDEGWTVLEGADDETLALCYRAADFVWSASRWEGFDLPLVEAQVAGRPVLALRAGAHPEVVKDGETGILTASAEEFSGQVATLLARGEEMGAAAAVWGE